MGLVDSLIVTVDGTVGGSVAVGGGCWVLGGVPVADPLSRDYESGWAWAWAWTWIWSRSRHGEEGECEEYYWIPEFCTENSSTFVRRGGESEVGWDYCGSEVGEEGREREEGREGREGEGRGEKGGVVLYSTYYCTVLYSTLLPTLGRQKKTMCACIRDVVLCPHTIYHPRMPVCVCAWILGVRGETG